MEEELFSACKDMEKQKTELESRVLELYSKIQTAEKVLEDKNSELKVKSFKIQDLQGQVAILQRAFGAKVTALQEEFEAEIQEQEHTNKPAVNDMRKCDGHKIETRRSEENTATKKKIRLDQLYGLTQAYLGNVIAKRRGPQPSWPLLRSFLFFKALRKEHKG
jgi:chromosome segregation ATPase